MAKRVAIFAGYNRYPAIEDYVLYYLKGLREVVDAIVYVADNAQNETYIKQLNGLAEHIVLQAHGEYDFGSWKIGLNLAEKHGLLNDVDELVLCNDSCYGPVFPFAEMFEEMSKRNCDFWGVTQNCHGSLAHVQSYFLVFDEKVFKSKEFCNFFQNVKREKCFWDIVSQYEIGLTQILHKNGGFTYDVFCNVDVAGSNPTTKARLLHKNRCPLIKKKFFTLGGYAANSKILLIRDMPNLEIQKYMKEDYFRYFWARIKYSAWRFIYQSKTTKSGKYIVKICKIPVIVRKAA